MLITADYYEPSELTGYARAALADRAVNQPGLARWLPNRTVDDLVYRFTKGGQGLTEAATYRSWDTPAPVSGRPGFTRVTGELPPISRSLRLDEYTRLRQRAAGGAAGGNAAIQAQILTDTEILVRQIAMRVEIARGQALLTGGVTINENGVQATVDFGRDPDMAVTPNVAWTDLVNANAFGNLREWCDLYEEKNGTQPGALLTSSRMVGLMLNQDKIRVRAGTLLGTPDEITREQLNSMLASRDLPPIYTYGVRYKLGNGSARIIPDNKVLLLPPPVDPNDEQGTDLGGTFWGTPAEALEPNYSLADSDQPGLVAGNYTTQNPVALWTVASGVSLPVLANPDLSLVADVA